MQPSSDYTIDARQLKYANLVWLVCASLLPVLIIAFSFELYEFARVQDVWVDESTQLSGITLKPWEMLRWLAGVDWGRFGVPGDRTPPISYLLDWSWLQLAGPSELGFRLFHSAFAIAGAVALGAVAWRGIGPSAATVVLAFLVLSPKLIQTGVEIRPYPILFAVTCAQIAVFLRLVASPNKVDLPRLETFTLICLVAIYTHFYGIVSCCAFFFALGIAFIRFRASLIALVVAFAFVIVGSWGLLPFLSSAVGQSGPIIGSERAAAQYFVYLLRLLGDSSNMISVPASILFFGGSLALLSAGLCTAFVRARRGQSRPVDWLFLVTIAGASAPMAASLFLRTFDVLAANYSGWLFAPLALLIGNGATSHTGFRAWDQAGRIVAVGAMLLGAAQSTGIFLAHSAMFVHGPNRFVGSLYDRAAGPKAIVYENGAAWGTAYFPLVFSHKGEIDQYLPAENAIGLIQIQAGTEIARPAVQKIEPALAPYSHLLLIDVQLRTYRDLRQCLDQMGACLNFAPGAMEGVLIETGQWKETKVDRSFGQYDTQVKILERVGGRLAPSGIADQ